MSNGIIIPDTLSARERTLGLPPGVYTRASISCPYTGTGKTNDCGCPFGVAMCSSCATCSDIPNDLHSCLPSSLSWFVSSQRNKLWASSHTFRIFVALLPSQPNMRSTNCFSFKPTPHALQWNSLLSIFTCADGVFSRYVKLCAVWCGNGHRTCCSPLPSITSKKPEKKLNNQHLQTGCHRRQQGTQFLQCSAGQGVRRLHRRMRLRCYEGRSPR